MRKKAFRLTFLSCVLLFLFSCLTINIYFPEAEVKKTAEEIVEKVRKSDKEEEKEKKVSFSLVPLAYAQQETEVTNPKIRALEQSLGERFPKLEPFFAGGNIGETNDGFVQVRDESTLSLQQKAQLRSLVKDENEDRKNLYAAVAEAKEIDPKQINRIQKIFADKWIEKAKPGWWIQKENGEWAKK
jgi:uncharacterized protein YdbL (DUF1318 family)